MPRKHSRTLRKSHSRKSRSHSRKSRSSRKHRRCPSGSRKYCKKTSKTQSHKKRSHRKTQKGGAWYEKYGFKGKSKDETDYEKKVTEERKKRRIYNAHRAASPFVKLGKATEKLFTPSVKKDVVKPLQQVVKTIDSAQCSTIQKCLANKFVQQDSELKHEIRKIENIFQENQSKLNRALEKIEERLNEKLDKSQYFKDQEISRTKSGLKSKERDQEFIEDKDPEYIALKKEKQQTQADKEAVIKAEKKEEAHLDAKLLAGKNAAIKKYGDDWQTKLYDEDAELAQNLAYAGMMGGKRSKKHSKKHSRKHSKKHTNKKRRHSRK